MGHPYSETCNCTLCYGKRNPSYPPEDPRHQPKDYAESIVTIEQETLTKLEELIKLQDTLMPKQIAILRAEKLIHVFLRATGNSKILDTWLKIKMRTVR